MSTKSDNRTNVALIWIAIYVVLMSLGESLNARAGMQAAATAPLGLLLTASLCLYMRRINGWNEYGFRSFQGFPFAKALYFVPLILLATVNLWRGAVLRFTPGEMALYVTFMLCTGFLEEIIFRGLLFRAMLQSGTRVAVLVSSLTFGLGHIVNLLNGAELFPTLLQMVYALAIGLVLSVFVLRTGNIIPCIAFHSIFNALSAFSNETGLTDGYRIMVCIVITAVSLGYAAWLWFKLPAAPEEDD